MFERLVMAITAVMLAFIVLYITGKGLLVLTGAGQ